MMETTTPDSDKGSSPMIQATMIWSSFMVSQALIVLVSQTAMSRTMSPPDQVVPASAAGAVHPIIFVGLAMGAAAAAVLVPKQTLTLAKKNMAVEGLETSLREIAKRVLPASIVRWMLIEMIVLVGFLFSMLSAQPSAIYPFAAASLLGFILTFPTEKKFRAFLQ